MAAHETLDSPAAENDVEAIFEAILKRPVGNDEYRKSLVSSNITIRQLLVSLRSCNELKSQVRKELVEIEGHSNIDAPATENDVEAMYQAILKRPVGNDEYRRATASSGITLRGLLVHLMASLEFKSLTKIEQERAKIESKETQRDPVFYRCPSDLVVTPTDIGPIIIVGSCLSSQLTRMRPNCISEFYLFGQVLPERPERPIGDYDFLVVQLPLRSVLPDGAFARLKQTDIEGHKKLFTYAENAAREFLRQAMRWNRDYGILTFVLPYLVPQQNLVGRLMPRYDLRNPAYFVEKLNTVLADELRICSNAYFFDVNEILGSYGKRYVQEDMVWAFNHGSYLTDFDSQHDRSRAIPVAAATQLYELAVEPIMLAVWEELLSVYRTVCQADMVKMVVIDLDETLWRGTVAELDLESLPTSEGWPIAFWEALEILKRRGILLAIISKNEESLVLQVWDRILGRNLPLEDITIHRINWRPKSENMAEILTHVNLLPRNVVYIDDNPMQRAEIKAAFPDIRVLGESPLTWRHILLWAAETQVSDITDESAARTEMVQAQVVREEQRALLSREEFFATLGVRINIFPVADIAHARFSRVLELVNKTNQFNTTGRRWTREECVTAFNAGTRFHAFEVADVYTDYGLVGVLIVDDRGIRQFVMSCRVMGLEAEVAAVAHMIGVFRVEGIENIQAEMVETERNLPCRDIFSRCGFEKTGDGWRRATVLPLPIPVHIAMSIGKSGKAELVNQD